jgi:predicted RNA-binding protein with PIN domain
MLYLVDGYNVTKSDPATAGLSIERQRDALVARLRARGRDLLGDGRIVVVFDGGEGVAHPPTVRLDPVTVVFSRSESADDVIVRMAAGARERVVVVSTDRELACRVRTHAARGSEIRERETLFEAATRRRPTRRAVAQPETAEETGEPPGGHEITRELEGLWLKEEE